MNSLTLNRHMPVLTLVAIVLAMCLAPLSGVATPTAPAQPDFAAIDRYIEAEMRDLRIPGLAIGIVQGDRIVHLKGFGVADPSGRRVTPQTPFIIGSTTKSFTALAIMQLVESGQLELDAPVQRYLPWFRVADETASAEDLTHYLIAQLNEGRYGAASVISPAGLAMLHRPAVPTGEGATSYAMGWKVGPTDGIPTIWHDGSVFNFHANIVLAPEGSWGVVILKNVYSLPDEISGTYRLTGIANGVTSMLMGQTPAARASTGLWLAYLALAGLIAIQALGMGRSVRRLRRWRTHEAHRPQGLGRVSWHVLAPLLGNLAWALAILAGLPRFFGMPLFMVVNGVPDFGYTLLVSAVVALGWGIVRTILALRALRKPVAPRPAIIAAKAA